MKAFDNMTLAEQLKIIGIIYISFVLTCGFILGVIIGEYNQMKFTEKIIDETASGIHGNNVIIFDGKYYQVTNFDINNYVNNTYFNITNASIIQR